MKKLALASAIAAVAMVSTGAHAMTGHIILTSIPVDITTDCAAPVTPTQGTPHGGVSVMHYNPATSDLWGMICLAPAGWSNYPYVLLDIHLTSNTGPGSGAGGIGTHMTGGQIDIYTDTTAASLVWTYVSSQPGASIQCPGLTGVAITPPPNVKACVANLLGMPAELWLHP